MRLRPDWKTVLSRAWSVRFMALAALAAFADGAVQAWLSGISGSTGFALVIGAISAGAVIARLVAQENLPHG